MTGHRTRARTMRADLHGTFTGYSYGCHCTPCTAANTAHSAAYRRDRAYGRTRPTDRVDFQPVHQQLLQLRDRGYTDTQIARLTGLPNQQINRLRKGQAKYVTRETAQRIQQGTLVANRFPARDLLAERYLDATGGRRRIRALATQGWDHHSLGRRLGHSGGYLSPLLYSRSNVTPAVHQAIAALYDELWNTPGPSDSTRIRALRKGWPPPLFWADERIDDPTWDGEGDYLRDIAADTPRARRDALAAQVHTLTSKGWSADRIGEHLRISSRTVVRVRSEGRTSPTTSAA